LYRERLSLLSKPTSTSKRHVKRKVRGKALWARKTRISLKKKKGKFGEESKLGGKLLRTGSAWPSLLEKIQRSEWKNAKKFTIPNFKKKGGERASPLKDRSSQKGARVSIKTGEKTSR